MPFVQIWIYRGKKEEYRRALLDGVQAAINEALGIPLQNVFQVLTELEPDHFRRAGWSSENFTLIEITIFPGRDEVTKKRLYQAVARNLGKAGVSGSDLIIMLRESPRENWSIRDGLPATETGVPR